MGNEKVNFWDSVHDDFIFPDEVLPASVAGPQSEGGRLAPYQTYLTFGDVLVYTQRSQFVLFENQGTRSLIIQNIQSSDSVFQVSENQLTIPPGESRNLRITFSPYYAQNYSASVSFMTNDPEHSHGTIFLTGRGISQ